MRKMILVTGYLIFALSTSTSAAPGDLDPTFGNGGIAITRGNSFDQLDYALAMAIQADGKIVVVGDGATSNTWDFAVVRYNTDGSLDTSFGGGGIVTTPVSSFHDQATSVAIQADGKIVVAGAGGSDVAVVRYNTNGSLDTSFNGTGKVITSASSFASDLVIQSDGKIIVAGGNTLIRYNPNGSVDTSFNGTGIVIIQGGGAGSLALQSDGKIVVAGGSQNSFAVFRYDTDGFRDISFNGTGRVVTPVGNFSIAIDLAIQSDGRIVVVGESRIAAEDYRTADFAVVRHNPNGSLDTSFGGTGKVIISFGNFIEFVSSVAIQSNGKIVVAGTIRNNSGLGSSFAVVRFNPNGALDTTFNGTGKVTTAFCCQEFTSEVAIQADGKIVVAGGTDDQIYDFYDFVVVRYQGDAVTPTPTCPNPIDCADFFVRQQYLDFLGREPDTTGFQNWVNTLLNCPNGGYGEFDNPHCDRVHVSAGFYQSDEFQARGFWAYRFYEVALDRRPTFAEFIPDMLRVGGPQSPQSEATSKAAYTNDFVLKQEFRTRYDGLSNAAYLNALEQNAEVTLTNKQALLDALNAGTKTRALVLREVVESQLVFNRFFNRGFVSMQYFGYLRRDPDTVGFQNWVNTLDANPNNFRHMIFGFIYSTEYRGRFGQP